MQADALAGGFADAPRDAAYAFRALMNVMARPGTIERLSGATPPAPLSVAAGTLLLTLADSDTPVHLAGDADTPEVRQWIAFHIGAPIAAPGAAMFACGTWRALQPIGAYQIGTPAYPDRSATLIVEQDTLVSEGETLSGPGIKDRSALNLPETETFARNARRFPLGLDFYFTAGDRVAALPRSTRIG